MKFLIVQTAFLGDVVLATPIASVLSKKYPESEIHFLVRKGNEGVLVGNPYISQVHVWEKREKKYAHLRQLIAEFRKEQFDWVINCQRFLSTGWLSVRVGRKVSGFDKNPLSWLFRKSLPHEYREGVHEVDRNLSLVRHLTDTPVFCRPEVFPSAVDFEKIEGYRKKGKYYVIAPASVWKTKELPLDQWTDLISRIGSSRQIYLVGGPDDASLCQHLVVGDHVVNLAGKLSLLQSAALMKGAEMNYTNDSGPMHLASAVNAPVTAVFCSTTPVFGFGPLSDQRKIAETHHVLDCRPCGIHGKKKCPLGHFLCSEIEVPI